DPVYLSWKARQYNFFTRFIELASEVNGYMPRWVVEKTAEGLNNRKKSINGSKLLIVGLAYKPNIEDMRESPSMDIMQLLVKKGAKLDYHDSFITVFPKTRDHDINMKSVNLTTKTIASYDAVILTAPHDDIDYAMIQKH